MHTNENPLQEIETKTKDFRQRKIPKLSFSGSVCGPADGSRVRRGVGDGNVTVTAVELVSPVYTTVHNISMGCLNKQVIKNRPTVRVYVCTIEH